MTKATDKLQGLIGKTVMYNTRNYKLLYFETEGDITRVGTDKKMLKFKNGQLEEFLKELSEVEETNLQIYKETSKGITLVSQMQDVIMDNIKKVQANPDYVPQAKEINKNVNSMIDLAKTQIEMLKIMHEK